METSSAPTTRALSGSGWTIAFYIRDALGLPFSSDVPHLEPAVRQRRRAERDRAVTHKEWRSWLDLLSSAPPGRPHAPADAGALLALYSEFEQEARDWEDAVVRIEPYRPEWSTALLEEAAHRGISGDVHQTEIVPVAGLWHASISSSRLLVSLSTWGDNRLMDELMRPRLLRALGLG